MGFGAPYGFGRLYWGATVIVVLGQALEMVFLAAIRAANDGRLTQGPRIIMRLAGWAPFVWLGVNAVYLAIYQILAAAGGDEKRRRLGAMALAPMGAGLVAAIGQMVSSGADMAFFLIGGVVFGYGALGLSMLAAGIWVAAQGRDAPPAAAEQETFAK